MYEDVQIVLRSEGGMTISLGQRNRKAFRARLLALGGEEIDRLKMIRKMPVEHLEEVRRIIAEEYPGWRIREYDERPKFRSPEHRVGWADIRSEPLGGGLTGFVNGCKLFRVSENYTRDHGRRYYLYTDLPGFQMRNIASKAVAVDDSPAAVQDVAEDIVREFLLRLGAQFIDEAG